MEVSNRAFGIFCVAVFGVVVYVRAQSVRTTPVVAAPTTVETPVQETKPQRVVRRSIPNSTLPPDLTSNVSTDDEPIIVSGDIPAPPQAPPATPAPATPAPTTPPATSDQATGDDLTYQDDIGDPAGQYPQAQTQDQQGLTDREILGIVFGALSPQQREEFRAMWFTMSPDDRQNLIDQVRGAQQGG